MKGPSSRCDAAGLDRAELAAAPRGARGRRRRPHRSAVERRSPGERHQRAAGRRVVPAQDAGPCRGGCRARASHGCWWLPARRPAECDRRGAVRGRGVRCCPPARAAVRAGSEHGARPAPRGADPVAWRTVPGRRLRIVRGSGGPAPPRDEGHRARAHDRRRGWCLATTTAPSRCSGSSLPTSRSANGSGLSWCWRCIGLAVRPKRCARSTKPVSSSSTSSASNPVASSRSCTAPCSNSGPSSSGSRLLTPTAATPPVTRRQRRGTLR